jgi:nucleotide-binding universal stress UspA family protein
VANGLFPKMLVPIDFSACSEVLLLHVVDTKSLATLNGLGLARPSEEAAQRKRLSHQARLNARRLVSSDEAKGVAIRRLVLEGSPFVEIARTARTEQTSLIVMGSYGGQTGNVEKIFFGSTAEKVVRTGECPVLCVPLPGRPTTHPTQAALRRMLLPSSRSEMTMRYDMISARLFFRTP